MSNFNVAAGEHLVPEKTLVASTVDKVTFDVTPNAVRIYSDGTASIFVRFDGTDPTVGDVKARYIPASPCARTFTVRANKVDVRLISVGTPKYSVEGVLA